jgi:UDP-glucose 4-epimerase
MDRYMQYLRDAYSFPMTLLRPFNTYGRKDNTHFVVERIISQMLADKPFIQLGDPTPFRDLMYIDDHVDAYLTCLDNEEAMEKTFNFCTGRGVSISDLVAIIKEQVGYGGGVKWGSGYRRPTEIPILIGDNSKACRVLGWRPRVSLEDGISLLITHLSERSTPYVRTNQ